MYGTRRCMDAAGPIKYYGSVSGPVVVATACAERQAPKARLDSACQGAGRPTRRCEAWCWSSWSAAAGGRVPRAGRWSARRRVLHAGRRLAAGARTRARRPRRRWAGWRGWCASPRTARRCWRAWRRPRAAWTARWRPPPPPRWAMRCWTPGRARPRPPLRAALRSPAAPRPSLLTCRVSPRRRLRKGLPAAGCRRAAGLGHRVTVYGN